MTPSKESAGGRWYDSQWSILVLLFLVLGPFALPLLWRSPRFSRPMKIGLTLVTVVYTLALMALGVQTVRAINAELRELEAF